LGRGQFAIGLANALISWTGTESLVLGLHGAWGSGKSSVKNMVFELLSQSERKPAIVEFNPWVWSGHDRLLTAFFDEVGQAVTGSAGLGDRSKELARTWKKYATRLALGGSALGYLKTAAEVMGIPWAPMFLGLMAKGSKQVAGVAESAAKAHEAAVEETTEALPQLKASLTKLLCQLDTPVLVVMDDVDRLHEEEICQLFQLIKVCADFPNVIYLLIFERSVIEKALTKVGGQDGRAYMEKIVQAGFDLPRVSQADLDRVLATGLEEILGFEDAERRFEIGRWQSLYSSCLQHFFRNLRNVRRYLSTLSFEIGLFLRNGTLEANLVDLIGIEVIRVFEPDLYRRMPESKDILLGPTSLVSALRVKESREEQVKDIDALVAIAAEENRDAIREILKELFPQVGWLLSDHGAGIGFEAGWSRDLRICHGDFFDRYFAYAVPHGDVPQSVVDKVIRLAGNREQLREVLDDLHTRELLVPLLQRLESYKMVISLEHAAQFVTALLDVGDKLPEGTAGMFGMDAEMIAQRIIYHYMRRETDIERRGNTVLAAIEDTIGHFLPVHLVWLDREQRGDQRGPEERLLSDDQVVKGRHLCLRKIEEALATPATLGQRLSFYLFRWKEWAGVEAPRAWVAKHVNTPDSAVLFLESLLRTVHRSVPPYVQHEIDLEPNGT
jgi:predicted KAP-like P-loop ATPase